MVSVEPPIYAEDQDTMKEPIIYGIIGMFILFGRYIYSTSICLIPFLLCSFIHVYAVSKYLYRIIGMFVLFGRYVYQHHLFFLYHSFWAALYTLFVKKYYTFLWNVLLLFPKNFFIANWYIMTHIHVHVRWKGHHPGWMAFKTEANSQNRQF